MALLSTYVARTHYQSNAYGSSVYGATSASNLPSDVKEGVLIPTWESLVARGLDAGSPYSRMKGRNVLSSPSVDWLWSFMEYNPDHKLKPASYRIHGPAALIHALGVTPGVQATLDLSQLQQRATIAFRNKVREEVSPFKALPFLGELRETIGMLRHPLKGIARVTKRYNRDLRRHPTLLKKAGHVSDGLSDLYLQWTYGVSPFLGDIEAIGSAAKKLVSTDPKPIPISVTFKEDRSGLYQEPRLHSYFEGAQFMSSCIKHSRLKVQIKGAVRSDVSHPLRDRAVPVLGISLEEFIPTIWELLPYSFLFDYISNVGDILGAKAVALSDLAWWWESDKQDLVYVTTLVPLPWSWPGKPGSRSPRTPTVAKIGNLRFNRHKPNLEVSFLRDFSFAMPSFGQAQNAAVLAFAQVRSLERKRDP